MGGQAEELSQEQRGLLASHPTTVLLPHESGRPSRKDQLDSNLATSPQPSIARVPQQLTAAVFEPPLGSSAVKDLLSDCQQQWKTSEASLALISAALGSSVLKVQEALRKSSAGAPLAAPSEPPPLLPLSFQCSASLKIFGDRT